MQHSLSSNNPAHIADIPGLYISDILVPSSPSQLTFHGITHVLSLMTTRARPNIPEDMTITHKIIELEDDAAADLLAVLNEAISFIESALSKTREDGNDGDMRENRILVHCLQGISRSGAVVVAYIMKTLKMPYGEALELVRKYRAVVCVNQGFAEQLKMWGGMGYCVRCEDGEGEGGVELVEAMKSGDVGGIGGGRG